MQIGFWALLIFMIMKDLNVPKTTLNEVLSVFKKGSVFKIRNIKNKRME
jgi:hypothetical protein